MALIRFVDRRREILKKCGLKWCEAVFWYVYLRLGACHGRGENSFDTAFRERGMNVRITAGFGDLFLEHFLAEFR